MNEGQVLDFQSLILGKKIETSDYGRNIYERLGAKMVPLMIIKGPKPHAMYGFSPRTINALLSRAKWAEEDKAAQLEAEAAALQAVQ